MTALSINLSNDLAQSSQNIAKKLGISRTQLIRQAIEHEVERLEKTLIIEAMAKGLTKLKNNPEYLAESQLLESGFSENMQSNEEDEDGWWQN